MADFITSEFATEAIRMEGRIAEAGRYLSPFSAVMEKGVLPDGMGFNFQSVTYERSQPNGNTWTAVQGNDGTTNTCSPTGNVIAPAISIKDWSAEQVAFDSNRICVEDVRRSYNSRQQAEAIRDNFEKNIRDQWEIKDREKYIYWARYKYVLNSSAPYTVQSPFFPAVVPISPITAKALRTIRNRMIRDGAQEKGSYAKQDGAPVFLVFMSSEQQAQIILENQDVRQDYRWADPKVLLAPFGLDRTYQGWFYMIDDKMPRYDFENGAYVERPFYSDEPVTIGEEAALSTAYENAAYELVLVYHPQVVTRLVPTPMASGGAGMTFDPVNYAGSIKWKNFENISDTYNNIDGTVGFWRARLMAGYKPQLTQYGYAIMVARCNANPFGAVACS